jgi:hypothetical protein
MKLCEAFKFGAEFDNRDYKPISSPQTLKEFMKGSIYADFKNELKVRIEMIRDHLEVAIGEEVSRDQGGCLFARLTENIFEDILANKLANQEEEAEKQEDTEGEHE